MPSLPKPILNDLARLTDQEAEEILYDWDLWARPAQRLPPGDWQTWLTLAGRGWGKTRVGAETVRRKVETGQAGRVALVAATSADARDVMVEGESGILAVSPPWNMPRYEPSKRRLTWPNGAVATTYSADEPNRLRGPQHDFAWADELAAWRFDQEAWDMLMFGLRLGTDPRAIVTTTPRPTALIKALAADPGTLLTRGSTYENRANLAPAFFRRIIGKYEGTRLGRQELNAEILDDVVGALWTLKLIEEHRVATAPELTRIVVAVDPAVSKGDNSNETGIIVAGIAGNEHAYVLEDLTVRGSPNEWAQAAVTAYRRHKADRIVAEVNQGGDMVESIIRGIDRSIPYEGVRATRGKAIRAEPVSALYERGRVHHVGVHAQLEDQMTNWTPASGEASPDRLDALVWAVTSLMDLDDAFTPADPIGWN